MSDWTEHGYAFCACGHYQMHHDIENGCQVCRWENRICKGFKQASERGEDMALNTEAKSKGVSSPNKYHAQRTNGYPSKKHAEYAAQLAIRQQAGEISFWLEEVPFRLPGGSTHRVDFGVFKMPDLRDSCSFFYFVEVKGRDLPMGKLKRRQVEELYGIRITVV